MTAMARIIQLRRLSLFELGLGRCRRRISRQFSSRNSSSGRNSLQDILRRVQMGSLTLSEAQELIQPASSASPEETLQSFANLDHGRAMRTGFPEAVFAAGKTPSQVAAILDDMANHVNKMMLEEGQSPQNMASTAILATRVTADQYKEISNIPLANGTITYHEMARIISMKASSLLQSETSSTDSIPTKSFSKKSRIVVACAGTTDLGVAEEAAVTLEAAGCDVDRVYDVGVAGLHRIIHALPRLRHEQVACVIVCAGMDGALPSVVGGLVSVPVIAVPTSVGYGAAFGGVSALLTMLNSCAPGVGVVNIDNGFGAAALAFKCLRNK